MNAIRRGEPAFDGGQLDRPLNELFDARRSDRRTGTAAAEFGRPPRPSAEFTKMLVGLRWTRAVL